MITINVKVLSKDFDNVYEDLSVAAHPTKTTGLAIARLFKGWSVDGMPVFGDRAWRIFHALSGWYVYECETLQEARHAAMTLGSVLDWTQSIEDVRSASEYCLDALRKIKDDTYVKNR